jgi:hypothetical protein
VGVAPFLTVLSKLEQFNSAKLCKLGQFSAALFNLEPFKSATLAGQEGGNAHALPYFVLLFGLSLR